MISHKSSCCQKNNAQIFDGKGFQRGETFELNFPNASLKEGEET
jgi:hypothetical protein